MPPPAPQNPFPTTAKGWAQAVGNAGTQLAAFTAATGSATSTVQGLVGGFQGLTSKVAGLGVGITALGAYLGSTRLKAAGIGVAGVGAAGILAGGVAGAGLGLAGAASPNGLASVDKAFDLLAGTIGSIVLPGVVALGGAAIMGASRIQAWIDKNLDKIIDSWTSAIVGATDAAKGFAAWWDRWKPGGENAQEARKAVFGIPTDREKFGAQGRDPNFPQERIPDAIARRAGLIPANGKDPNFPQERKPDPEAAAGLRELAGNMRMITRDMQQSILRPSLTDPVGKWKEVALQIQNSELEMRKLDMQQKAIDASNRLADALEKRADKIDPPQQQGGAFIGGRLRIGR